MVAVAATRDGYKGLPFRLPRGRRFLEQTTHRLDEPGHVELARAAAASVDAGREVFAPQRADLRRERLRVGREEPSRLPGHDALPEPALVDREHDLPGGHRLDRRHAEVLVLRRADQAAASRVQADELRLVHFAPEFDVRRRAQSRDVLGGVVPARVAADDDEALAREGPERLELD